jgi:hypothetical protein
MLSAINCPTGLPVQPFAIHGVSRNRKERLPAGKSIFFLPFIGLRLR